MEFFISNAMAQDGASTGGGIEFMLMIGIFFAIMYFMIIRPQSKRTKEHKQMLSDLKKGDEIVTNGGLLGKVSKIGDNFIEMKAAENTVLKVQRQAVATVMPKGTMKST